MIKSLHLGPLVIVWNSNWPEKGLVSGFVHVSRAMGFMSTLRIGHLYVNFDVVR